MFKELLKRTNEAETRITEYELVVYVNEVIRNEDDDVVETNRVWENPIETFKSKAAAIKKADAIYPAVEF